MATEEAHDADQQARYHELCAYTLTHPDPSFIHQHVVDAFAAQTANAQTKPITLTFALVGLYLLNEKSYSGKNVQHVHMLLAKRRKHWPKFAMPERRGSLSVSDVMAVPPGRDRDDMIRKWCASVWEAYAASHTGVIELLETELP